MRNVKFRLKGEPVSNKFFIIVLASIAIFIGAFFVTKDKSNTGPSGSSSSQTSNHVKGNAQATVTLVEYGDFQCPACKAYYPIVEQTVEKYKADIKFQFRNFPLVQIHQHAFEGSRAAEAASNQGKFWEMYGLLYENQTAWSSLTDPLPTFVGYAKQIGLDTVKFQTDYASVAVNDVINADYQAAMKIGASSTPTFVLNGKKIDKNPESAEAFEKLITDAIATSKKAN